MATSAPQTFAANIVASGQRAAARTDTSAGSTTRTATFDVWRGAGPSGQLQSYTTSVSEGLVVLDAIHQIQSESATDLAVRWNCKAGKCGSCSAEINGIPRLMCMTRLSELDLSKPVTVEPMRAFPLVRDLVTDVSWNYRAKKSIRKFQPRPADAADGTWRMFQADVERVQEFRKCIECFLCQDVCHVLRDHQLFDQFVGPRFLLYASAQDRERHRVLQHHKVLHEGLSREHRDYRQRHHPAERAGDRPALRPGRQAVANVSYVNSGGPPWNSSSKPSRRKPCHARSRRPSAIGCSRSPSKPRASASTPSSSTRRITRPS